MSSSPKRSTGPLPSDAEAFPDGEGAEGLSAAVALVYPELRALATQHLRRERAGHTLQTTGLVHEAFLRLERQRAPLGGSRERFLALAATMMRRILVDHARARQRLKKGGGRLLLDEVDPDRVEGPAGAPPIDVLALHEALLALARRNARRAQVVELRFFGGLNLQEIAGQLEVSMRTVNEDWAFGRAWLHRELSSPGGGEGP